MKRILPLLTAVSVLFLLLYGFAAKPAVRIGAFDSRAIAIAHANSPEGREFVMNLIQDN